MAVLDTPHNSTMRLMGKFCVKVNLSTSVSGSYYLTAESHREPLWDKAALPPHNLFVPNLWRLRLLSAAVRCLAVIDWVAAELLLWVDNRQSRNIRTGRSEYNSHRRPGWGLMTPVTSPKKENGPTEVGPFRNLERKRDMT